MEVDELGFYNRLLDHNNILFLCHRNADPDAVGSAYAIAEAIGGVVGVVEGCNRVASMMVKSLDIHVVQNPNPEDYDFTVVVDTSTQAQLAGVELSDYAVLDHHSTCSLKNNADFYIHKDVSSTAEIVFEILQCMGAPIMRKPAIALMTGIITDSGNFKYASPKSFRTIARIIESSGVEYGEVVDMLAGTPQDISIRIATLKAATRANIHRAGEYIIATSIISSFGGAAAGVLIHIGADVAFVGANEKDGVIRISGRARRNAIDAGINLGRILEEVSSQFNGTGGGHDGAAGLDVEDGDVDQILQKCVDITLRNLEEK